jgi:large subunit ribosomal protein L6
MSRIGKKPIIIPKSVKVEVENGCVCVEGPKGTLRRTLPAGIILENTGTEILVKRQAETKEARSLHGLMRALILNMVNGVVEGYSRQLQIVGVGFRVQAGANNLTLQLGFSHPVNFSVPEGVKIEVLKQNQIAIKGIDKELVGKVAAEIRSILPPEPYKGKGIRYKDEFVRKKLGKAATK